jgi:hypothetical protein
MIFVDKDHKEKKDQEEQQIKYNVNIVVKNKNVINLMVHKDLYINILN